MTRCRKLTPVKLVSNKPKETQMSDKVKLKCDIYWAQLNRKNEMSDAYQVNLCNLSDKAVAALEDMGISIQENAEKKPEMGKYITCKSQKPIKAFDTDGVDIIEDIGNGSKAVCMISAYSWTYKNKKVSALRWLSWLSLTWLNTLVLTTCLLMMRMYCNDYLHT
jgi:hypothetical protein